MLRRVVWLILANISEELTSFTITVNAYQFLQENLLKIAYLRNEKMIGYIKMNLSETEWEVEGTGSESCQKAGFGVRDVEYLGSVI
jgi:hypothetical protein